MGDNDERQPLVQTNQSANPENVATRTVVLEGPPVEPETPTPRTGTLDATVPCQVCRAVIVLDGKSAHHVAKCTECGEATPIKGAPPGKKYVRCPCRCLLICKSSSARIACPRPNCKLTINLAYTDSRLPNPNIQQGPQTSAPAAPGFAGYGGINAVPGISTGHVDLVCGACGSPFVINGVSAMDMLPSKARCPSCKRINSVGPGFARRRFIVLLLVGLVIVAAGVALTVGTLAVASENHGVYVAWACVYSIGLGVLVRAFIYACMPITVVQFDQSPAPRIPAV